jgi:hypothetical protein
MLRQARMVSYRRFQVQVQGVNGHGNRNESATIMFFQCMGLLYD